jgi:hypothetical protein
VTDPKNTVVLGWQDRTLVISRANADRFRRTWVWRKSETLAGKSDLILSNREFQKACAFRSCWS